MVPIGPRVAVDVFSPFLPEMALLMIDNHILLMMIDFTFLYSFWADLRILLARYLSSVFAEPKKEPKLRRRPSLFSLLFVFYRL